ncbi:hypothetical protein FA15DRAFT_459907 [Coprinopsis marcescibilis]|uniref:F-box domain-containing protein n=1 Tax=Coprinopsis marcescibilis TaxID=230819 RepID=A0A5C3KST0_COPMA|nr:hypothetical protein FA15DRAFT_459907 [Coprinopsis marcescibilis]
MSDVLSDHGSGASAVALPAELIISIIRPAAQSSKRTCYSLCLVNKWFYQLLKDDLFGRLDNLTNESVTKLNTQILTKHASFFDTEAFTRSISLAKHIPEVLVAPVFEYCSKRLTSFAAYSDDTHSPGMYFPLIESPHLHRLCLIWMQPPPDVHTYMPYYQTGIFQSITRLVLQSLTHLIVYFLDDNHFFWTTLLRAQHRLPKSSDAFQQLTHMALRASPKGLPFIRGLVSVAKNLKYVVCLHDYRGSEVQTQMSTEAKLREWNDRRCVVVDKNNGWGQDSSLLDSCEQELFWMRVEELVEGGYINDSGTLW